MQIFVKTLTGKTVTLEVERVWRIQRPSRSKRPSLVAARPGNMLRGPVHPLSIISQPPATVVATVTRLAPRKPAAYYHTTTPRVTHSVELGAAELTGQVQNVQKLTQPSTITMDSSNQCNDCGRPFANAGALFSHQRSRCKATKRGLKEVLSDAKRYWERRVKRPRTSAGEVTAKTTQGTSISVTESSEIEWTNRHYGSPSSERPTERESVTVDYPSPQTTANEPNTNAAPTGDSTTYEVAAPILGRLRTVAAQHRETSPEPPAPVPPQAHVPPEQSAAPTARTSAWVEQSQVHRTSSNKFGLYREFFGLGLPKHDPDSFLDIQELGDGPLDPALDEVTHDDAPHQGTADSYHPYPNRSSFELSEWFWGGQSSTNSLARFDALTKVVGDPEFVPADIRATNWAKLHRLLPHAKTIGLDEGVPDENDWVDDTNCDWVESKITIEVPFPTQGRGSSKANFDAGVLHHRTILSVIKEKLQDPQEHYYRHYTPYKLFWQPDSDFDPIRVHGELYSSDEFLKVDAEVQQLDLGEEDPGLERVVLALMFWTDATLLANFGTAKLWPCYMFFGNDSKYRRGKPSTNLCNHIAYFEPLPDSFKDWYRAHTGGKSPSADLITHCNREIFHEQWRLLLDDDLLGAMRHGIRVSCVDGVTRLFFPRIFTYSADYLEKALIATIRSLGTYPCPRCLVPKSDMNQAGTGEDKSLRSENPRVDTAERREKVKAAREKIFDQGYAVNSRVVDEELKSNSMVPVKNAFSKVTDSVQFDIFKALVVDLMHEFELGVWRTLFTHLIRILEAEDRISKRSYRLMSPFGIDTIRKFTSNMSEMKRLGARDYENLLQETCSAYDTRETSKEHAARLKRIAKSTKTHQPSQLQQPTGTHHVDPPQIPMPGSFSAVSANETPASVRERLPRPSQNPPPAPSVQSNVSAPVHLRHSPAQDPPATDPSYVESNTSVPAPDSKGRLRKTLNLNTYKYHALCDYVETIRRFGTTDSYTSERGELEHKLPKSWYLRTDKRAYRAQLARIERRRANIRKIRRKMRSARNEPSQRNTSWRYRLSQAKNSYEPLSNYVQNEANLLDPALQDFLPKLQRHLLPRIKTALRERRVKAGLTSPLDPSDLDDWSYVVIQNYRLHVHKIIRFRYTTYDVRQDEDIVQFVGGGNMDFKPERLDFLFVRWYSWNGADLDHNGGLDELSFPPLTDPDAFGFVNPEDVIRACHILPRISIGHVSNAEDISMIAKDSQDYPSYVVNRDMYMRFRWGYGIGHRYSHHSRRKQTNIQLREESTSRDGLNSSNESHGHEACPSIRPSRMTPLDAEEKDGEAATEEAEDQACERLGADDMVWEGIKSLAGILSGPRGGEPEACRRGGTVNDVGCRQLNAQSLRLASTQPEASRLASKLP
ncbi:ubiquitin and ribosomal protein S27a [Coprinopsis cinerea okayama7|uniref:Ubiquitin and ribosomal protein S27a n=1 Tax=Coprinopsis cinerea (strain Okayama-7 / 130 / ATCC MYA-4618 / FGSC 9003) TaxID=240176 RepID=D6RQ31_COPC7|nr:ubiquitin and ribosomal protein S27a [Coprinopsis cinerea okayama7\|eukprot:XP_002910445.1 ubiquitin and ribosomal protein S27a [Coprinopsis cinerea okayama7\